MMVANALELTQLPVEEEPFLRHILDAADAKAGGIFIYLLAVGKDTRTGFI